MGIYQDRLAKLREKIINKQLDCAIVTIYDEFLSEYTPSYANRLRWLTGFTGSNGMVVITKDDAVFFTDGRYILQAEHQLPSYKIYDMNKLSPYLWIKKHLSKEVKIGFDGNLIGYKAIAQSQSIITEGIFINIDLVDQIWTNKPNKAQSKLFIHDIKYSGCDYLTKIKQMAEKLETDAYVISCPESVCWLLNIRANDIDYNPVALTRAILYKNGTLDLFTDSIVDDELSKYLSKINILPLDSFYTYINHVNFSTDHNFANYNIVNQNGRIIEHRTNQILLTKACKNQTQIQGAIDAHIEDGVALCKFLYYMDHQHDQLSEIIVAEKLENFRKESKNYISPSFATICGFRENGAIIHYHADETSNKQIKGDGILLIDSGGQYPYGTTDITRTIAIGTPTKEQKENFTRVLKGHIAIANARFPIGTTGSQLDCLARYHLWQVNLDYPHGTGHGVSCFLNVHEGPQRISKTPGDAALQVGMILSNEPGYYKKNEYGIRIENLMITKQDGNYLYFKTITLAPIDPNLIDHSLLDKSEISWLNDYHQQIISKLSQSLDANVVKWLQSL
jgi:Xaa-Pro aminopeptidase